MHGNVINSGPVAWGTPVLVDMRRLGNDEVEARTGVQLAKTSQLHFWVFYSSAIHL